MSEKYKIIVKGKVQGVFFRDYTKKKADSMGLKGTVQNLSDGSVKIVVEHTENIQDFIDWCWMGSPASSVEDVELEKFNSDEEFSSFEILL